MHVAILFLFQLQVGVPVIEIVCGISMTVNVTDDIIASSATSGGNISLYNVFAEAEIVLENKIKIKTKNKINFFILTSREVVLISCL